VEDNALVREVTHELLENDDREVIALDNAEEALEQFKNERFDVVITDISLPVMSGLDLARALLAMKPGVPIIVASGYALTEVVQNLGPSVRTIVKPFQAEQIDALIAELGRA
jgi:CheY-like chemotaxis protein